MLNLELTPPHQEALARNAMLSLGTDMIGDGPAQYAVLALAVRLAEAGIEPVEEFKQATMQCLKRAVDTGQMPSKNKRGQPRKGDDASTFEIAVIYWREYLERGARGANMRATQEAKVKRESQVTNAVKMHGPLAKRRALWDLAFGDEAGPNIKFARMYHDLEEELVAGKHTRVKPKGRRSCDWRWITK